MWERRCMWHYWFMQLKWLKWKPNVILVSYQMLKESRMEKAHVFIYISVSGVHMWHGACVSMIKWTFKVAQASKLGAPVFYCDHTNPVFVSLCSEVCRSKRNEKCEARNYTLLRDWKDVIVTKWHSIIFICQIWERLLPLFFVNQSLF